MGFGDYPPEYDAKHHGPYDPARYYGKPDTPFGNVKLGEIGAWLSRREKCTQALAGLFSRAWWRWNHKYVLPKRAGIAPLFQLLAGSCLFFYGLTMGKPSTIEITNIIKLLMAVVSTYFPCIRTMK